MVENDKRSLGDFTNIDGKRFDNLKITKGFKNLFRKSIIDQY